MTGNRPAFFSVPALVLLGVLVTFALYVLHPRQAVFEDDQYIQNPDALSLSYLEILLRSAPDNESLRLNLARMQANAGQYPQARRTLAPLLNRKEGVPYEARELGLTLLLEKLYASGNPQRRRTTEQELAQVLTSIVRTPYSVNQKLALIQPSLPALDPGTSATVLAGLMAEVQGPRRIDLARDLAAHYEASGNLAMATDTLHRVLPDASAEEQAALVNELIRLHLARGRPNEALTLFRNRQLDTRDPESLQDAIRLARLAGARDAEVRYLVQLGKLAPEDLDVQRTLLQVQLARQDAEGALTTAQRLRRQQDELSLDDRQRVAQVLEWNGQPEQALSLWQDIYLESGSREAFNRGKELARGLFRWENLTAILNGAARRGQLSPEDYVLLVDTLVYRGQFDEAEKRLREGYARYPRHEGMSQRLISFYENTRQYPKAIALLVQKEALSDRERILLANFYWRTRNPGAALQTLQHPLSDPEYESERVDMQLDLAVMLGREDLLRDEYRRLLNLSGQGRSVEVDEQLLNLAIYFQDYPTALALSKRRYEQTGALRYLASMAEYQLAQQQWNPLGKTLEQWQEADSGANRQPRFWVMKAALYQHRDQDEAAAAAYRRASRLGPDNTDVMMDWAWFLISNPDYQPGELPRLLAALANADDPTYYPVLAYGYGALGDTRQSVRWFRLGHETGQASREWLGSYADALDSVGAQAVAFRLRRLVRRQEGEGDRLSFSGLQRDDYRSDPNLPLFNYRNRSVQAQVNLQELGGFSVQEDGVRGVYSDERLRWQVRLDRPDVNGNGLFLAEPDPSPGGAVTLQNNNADLLWSATLGQEDRLGSNDLLLGLDLGARISRELTVGVGHTEGERAYDSAEAWWIAGRNETYLSGNYRPDSRLELSGRVASLSFDGPSGSTLAEGNSIEAGVTYTLERENPGWALSVSYQRQRLNNMKSLDDESLSALASGVTTQSILSEDYERIGLYQRWWHGEPHALYRTTPSPRWFMGLGTGYVLSTNQPDFGVDAGIGWRLTGDDELALSGGWTSDGLSGDSRFGLNLTYTLYLGGQ